MAEPTRRFTLRDLPFVARLTLAVFLCSVGLGFFAAIVQVHTQDAKAGEQMPDDQDLIDKYHGRTGMSTLERLITTPESAPFATSGTMRPAFTTRSGGWENAKTDRAGDIEDLDDTTKKKKLAEAEASLRRERYGEAEALLHWISVGKLDKKAYDEDSYPFPESMKDKPASQALGAFAGGAARHVLPESLKETPITARFIKADDNGNLQVKVASLMRVRCAKCHTATADREASFAPLDTYSQIKTYANPEQGGMPLRKLAQTTHVHLLGFSMLYMLTGFLFACSSWPGIIRFFIAPLALVAQMVDISFWWLARLQDPYGSEFARSIAITGKIAGAALGLQIILTLFSLFGWFGRFVILLLILIALAGALYFNPEVIKIVAPDLAQKKLIPFP